MFRLIKPRALALAMLATVMLGACASPVPQPTPQPTIQPAGTATPGATAVAPTAQPPAATAQATVVATAPATVLPTRPAGQQPLLGPEWVVLGQGDLYGTGAETVVAYRPSSFGVARAQLPPQYVGYGVVLEQLVIVERNALGQPFVRVLATPGGVVLDGDNANPRFPPGGPNSRTVAFALAMEHQSAPPRLVPLDQQGMAVEQGFTVSYDAVARRFVLNALTLPGDPAAPWPGPEWVEAHRGDFNGDGLVERVLLRPSALVPDPAFNSPVYAGYSWVADTVYIAQEQNGMQRLLASISLSEVRAEQVALIGLTNPQQGPEFQPAAFLVMAPQSAQVPVSVIPLNSAGKGYAQGFGLTWDAGTGAYRLAVGPADNTRAGVVSGRVAYPAGGAPPLEVYAVSVDDPSRFYMTTTGLNNTLFSLRVPAGRYQLFAYTMPGSEVVLTGAYTEYMRCGERPECSDHGLVTLAVNSGESWDGIVIGDWFTSSGVFPERPQGQPQPQP